MFSSKIQSKLKSNGFDLTCEEENIWVKEIGDDSVTISGEDNDIEAIWQNFEGSFEEFSHSNIDEVIEWSKTQLGKK